MKNQCATEQHEAPSETRTQGAPSEIVFLDRAFLALQAGNTVVPQRLNQLPRNAAWRTAPSAAA